MPVKDTLFADNLQWIDLANPTREEIERINQEYGFHHHLLHDCLDPGHLPKYDEIKSVHFILVRYYNHSIDYRMATVQDLTSKIAFFFTDRLLVTIHRADVHFLHEVQRKCIDRNEVASLAELIAKMLWHVLHTFEDPAMRLSEEVDFFESHIFLKDTNPSQLQSLYFIKQKATLCQRLLMLTLEPLNRLKAPPDDDAALDDVKDLHLKIEMLYSSVLEDVSNLMNIYISLSAQKTNDVMKVLTIFSVFFYR